MYASYLIRLVLLPEENQGLGDVAEACAETYQKLRKEDPNFLRIGEEIYGDMALLFANFSRDIMKLTSQYPQYTFRIYLAWDRFLFLNIYQAQGEAIIRLGHLDGEKMGKPWALIFKFGRESIPTIPGEITSYFVEQNNKVMS